jgi:hypothetical protein
MSTEWHPFVVDGETYYWNARVRDLAEETTRIDKKEREYAFIQWLSVARQPDGQGAGQVVGLSTEVTEEHAIALVRVHLAHGKTFP